MICMEILVTRSQLLLQNWILPRHHLCHDYASAREPHDAGTARYCNSIPVPDRPGVDDEPSITKLCRQSCSRQAFPSSDAEALRRPQSLYAARWAHRSAADGPRPPPRVFNWPQAQSIPHVHGHELAVRALRIRKDSSHHYVRQIDQDLAGYGLRREAFILSKNHLTPRALSNLCSRHFTHLHPQPRV